MSMPMEQKILKVLICKNTPQREAWTVLNSGKSSGKSVYNLLPADMDVFESCFQDWNGNTIRLEELSSANVPGGMWLFAGDSKNQVPDIENRMWLRGRIAARISENLQLQISSPEIAFIRPLQVIKAPADCIGLYADSHHLYLMSPTSLTIVDSRNLKKAISQIRHSFISLEDFIISRDRVLLVDQESIRAFSISNGNEISLEEPISAVGSVKKIFSGTEGFLLINSAGCLYQVSHGSCIPLNFAPPGFSQPIDGVAISRGRLLVNDGRHLYAVNTVRNTTESLYESHAGCLRSFACLPKLAVIIDEGRIKIVSIESNRQVRHVVAEFSGNGHDDKFIAPHSIVSDGKNRFFVMDGNEICSFQVFPFELWDIPVSKQEDILQILSDLPEGPFLLNDEAISVVRHTLNSSHPDRRDLILAYAKRKKLLDNLTGKTALREMFVLAGIKSFLAFHEKEIKLFFHDAGKMYRLDPSYSAICDNTRADEPLPLDNIQIIDLMEESGRTEEHFERFNNFLNETQRLKEHDKNYDFVLIEKGSLNLPFKINEAIGSTVSEIVRDCRSQEDQSRAIFGWFEKNIRYGETKRNQSGAGYFDALEVFSNREGVCGEMAILYCSMARLAGLKSHIVMVDRDYKGKEVNHACAGVELNGRLILVDPAYHTFDIAHQAFRPMSDSDFFKYFQAIDKPVEQDK